MCLEFKQRLFKVLGFQFAILANKAREVSASNLAPLLVERAGLDPFGY